MPRAPTGLRHVLAKLLSEAGVQQGDGPWPRPALLFSGPLGRIAHDAVLDAAGLPRGSRRFGHAAEHELPDGRWLLDSYHCSRYNTQTRRLTADMFRAVLQRAVVLAG